MIEPVSAEDFILGIIGWIFIMVILMILIEYCNMRTLNNLICSVLGHSEREVQRRQWQSGGKFEIFRCSRCHGILGARDI